MSSWANAALLSAHGIGMALIVGLATMTSLRVLGFPKGVPLGAYRKTVPVLYGAFALNAGSGVLLFIADASSLAINPSFQTKLVCIVVGLAILWGLYRGPVRQAHQLELSEGSSADYRASLMGKALAVATILMWMGSVIISGRLIAYLKQI